VIKRLYLVNGNLTQPLDKYDEDIAVDSATAIQLATLNVGDWCYLTLIEGYKLEVIKVTKLPSWYWVDRAQDGTCQFSFSIKAKIVYRLTSQEIKDAVSSTPLSIYPDGYGAIEVSTGVNSWQISYQDISIQTLGGISWMNPDGYEIVITDNNGMFGCCDGSLTGAPYAGGVPFYLTSEIYAYFGNDVLTPNPKYNGHSLAPLDTNTNNWYLLTQPSILDKYIGMYVPQLGDWELYGSSGAFTAPPEWAQPYICIPGEWSIFGGMKQFQCTDQYISTDAYPLEMFTFGSEVDYNNAIDQYINTYPSVKNWTLS
jgi:hypothetical protein